MVPKDLLADLETGDRTKEMLRPVEVRQVSTMMRVNRFGDTVMFAGFQVRRGYTGDTVRYLSHPSDPRE